MLKAFRAGRLNEKGRHLEDAGDKHEAEIAYRAALATRPTWSVPAYNLGLLCKYQGRWAESLAFNQQATQLDPKDQAAWWNLGIAATALANWPEARRAWHACGQTPPAGDGPPEFHWGKSPVRLDPDSSAEVVWARRLDPARAEIASIPLPGSRFKWRDVVLTDGAPSGQRVVNGRTFNVFDALGRLSQSPYRTFVIELATTDTAAVDALIECAASREAAAENWGAVTRLLCHACSVGLVHEHGGAHALPAHPHCGLAARDPEHASAVIEAWLASTARSDLTTWYEAPTA